MSGKILMISAEFPPDIGGIATISYNIAKGLKRMGIDIAVLTTANGMGEKGDIKIYRTPGLMNRKFLKILPLAFYGIHLIFKEKPRGLILTKWTHEGPVGLIIKKLFGIDYILIAHGTEIRYFLDFPNFVKFIIRRIFDNALRVIAVSNYTRELLEEMGVNSNKILVLHNSIDVNEYNLEIDVDDVKNRYGLKDKRVILTVARLVKRKGHDVVLRAVSELKDSYRDLVYVITGDGEYRENLVELARKLGIGDRVIFTGFVSNKEELQKLYKVCDIFIMPSREEGGDVEGFGISFLEANLYGKPVIGGRSGGVGEAIVDGVTGFLVDPTDVTQIVEKLKILLDDPVLARKMGEEGRKRVLDEFNLEKRIKVLIKEGVDLLCR
jgi:phosphatidylinositol alpha-1,6-mannosyltransferase